MFSMEGILYRTATWIYYFAYLNILFLVSCIPIITIYPATAALFGVVRQWVKRKEPPVFTTYRMLFVDNFKQSMIVGPAMTALGIFLLSDFYLLSRIQTGINLWILICLTFIGFYFMISALYLFPLMINGYYSIKQLVITALKFALYKPHLTLLNLIILVAWLYFSLSFPFFLIFFFPSVSAYITYWFAEQKISKLVFNQTQTDTVNSDFSILANDRK